jgi:hypothetical protein
MIKFLTKGILRDRSRSLFPVLVVTLTVAMIVFFQGFMTGTIIATVSVTTKTGNRLLERSRSIPFVKNLIMLLSFL